MNILHMKYVVEVAKAGSINKAAEALMIAQPNLSRSIKEMEADLGIRIFLRSAKGMVLTPEGEQFVKQAVDILHQIDGMEKMYRNAGKRKKRIAVSVPRSTYISEAFAKFSNYVTKDEPADITYHETNAANTIADVLEHDYNLGIIRYAASDDRYFKTYFEEQGLSGEFLYEFHYVLAISKNSPLAQLENIHYSDLSPYIEIKHADHYDPNFARAVMQKEENEEDPQSRILLYERASQFDLLSENPRTYMWVSPLTDSIMDRYGLVLRPCVDNIRPYREVMIHKKGYRLTKMDKMFVTEVCMARRKYIH